MTLWRLAIAAAVLGLAAAACTTEDGGDLAATEAPTAEAVATPETAAAEGSPEPEATVEGCPEGHGIEGRVDDRGTEPAPGSEFTVEAGDFFFDPTCATEVPEGTVTITFPNTGDALHNVSVPEQDVDVDLAVGKTITVEIAVGAEAVPYFCKYHRTAGMKGSLVPS